MSEFFFNPIDYSTMGRSRYPGGYPTQRPWMHPECVFWLARFIRGVGIPTVRYMQHGTPLCSWSCQFHAASPPAGLWCWLGDSSCWATGHLSWWVLGLGGAAWNSKRDVGTACRHCRTMATAGIRLGRPISGSRPAKDGGTDWSAVTKVPPAVSTVNCCCICFS